jgi:hypothetical protein
MTQGASGIIFKGRMLVILDYRSLIEDYETTERGIYTILLIALTTLGNPL